MQGSSLWQVVNLVNKFKPVWFRYSVTNFLISFSYMEPCQTPGKGLIPETLFCANFLEKVSIEKLSKSSFVYSLTDSQLKQWSANFFISKIIILKAKIRTSMKQEPLTGKTNMSRISCLRKVTIMCWYGMRWNLVHCCNNSRRW